MSACLRVLVALATVAAASTATAQGSTDLHARNYVLSAFISGAAAAIVSDDVVLAPGLRARLPLAKEADSRAIYEALFALTEDKRLKVRNAAPEEMPNSLANGHKAALVALQAEDVRLYFQYDLERDKIVYVADDTAAAVPAAAVAPDTAKRIELAPIHFAFDRASLDAEDLKALERESSAQLLQAQATRYVVRGYADDIGTPSYNERLSRQRAEAVRDYLVAKGADPAKIELRALGSTMPQARCSPELERAALLACLAPNRRVEVEVELTAR